MTAINLKNCLFQVQWPIKLQTDQTMNIFISIIVVILSILPLHSADETLNIDIYYESLCRFSKAFIVEQVTDAYKYYNETTKPTAVFYHFIPFGKSQVPDEGETDFMCQHGSLECSRNMFQSCALNEAAQNQRAQIDFVVCAMQVGVDDDDGYKNCALDHKISMTSIQDCIDGNMGMELQLQAEKETSPFILITNAVPTVVFGKIYNQNEHFQSIESLALAIQDKLKRSAKMS